MKKRLFVFGILLFIYGINCDGGSLTSTVKSLPENGSGTAEQTISDQAKTDATVIPPTGDENSFADTDSNAFTTDKKDNKNSIDKTTEKDSSVEQNPTQLDSADNGQTTEQNSATGNSEESETTSQGDTDTNNQQTSTDTNTTSGKNDSLVSNNTGSSTDQVGSAAVESEGAVSGTSQNGTQDLEKPAKPLMEISNNDKSKNDGVPFDFSTINTVEVNMLFKDIETDTPIQRGTVAVYDKAGFDKITDAFTNDDGVASFNVSTDFLNDGLSVIITHPEYTPVDGYKIIVDDISKIEVMDREIKIKKIEEENIVKSEDSDGDGIADIDDDYPTDSKYAKIVKGEFVLAFEDLFPGKGDADFNDAVIKLSIEERINADNKIAYIKIGAQPLASGAGYNSIFGIYAAGKKYVLIDNIKKSLNNNWNTKPGDRKCVPGTYSFVEIIPTTPLDRADMIMPYDPYLVPNGASKKSTDEIHLSFVKSKYTGKKLDTDGFPWAIVVPGNWYWPLEGKSGIFNAYPQFKTWYQSSGKEAGDWYMNPEMSKVYSLCNADSALTGYIFNTAKNNIVMIMAVLMTSVLIIISLHVVNSRRKENV